MRIFHFFWKKDGYSVGCICGREKYFLTDDWLLRDFIFFAIFTGWNKKSAFFILYSTFFPTGENVFFPETFIFAVVHIGKSDFVWEEKGDFKHFKMNQWNLSPSYRLSFGIMSFFFSMTRSQDMFPFKWKIFFDREKIIWIFLHENHLVKPHTWNKVISSK